MTGDAIPSLIMQIVDELRAHGFLITNRAGEWRGNVRGGTDAAAYVTDDLQDDVVESGEAMAPTTAEPIRRRRRKWRRPKSAKAARRAFIRAHNRRRRARSLTERRKEI